MSILSTLQTNVVGPWFAIQEKHLIKCTLYSSILIILLLLQGYIDAWLWYMQQWTAFISSKHYYRATMEAEKMQMMVHIWINEFIIWTVLREDIQVLFEGDPIRPKEKRQVVMANHRSILDYVVIQSQLGADNVVFAGWTTLMKYPSLMNFWTVFRNDENASVSVSKFKRFYGPESIVIFPEVNIFTPEVKVVERKLMKQKYKGLPVLHNVLYPRFGTFVNLMKALSNDSDKKWCRMLEQLILPTETVVGDSVNLLDLTLIYYKVTLTADNEYKLEQTTPSLWEVWSLESPMIVYIHSTNHDITKLVFKKPRQIEAWLENQWCYKDKLIDTFELDVEVV